VTREGQLIFFAQFLKAGGRWEQFVERSPLKYTGARFCVGVELLGDKEHAARHALPGLWALLDELPRTHWPAMVRGDCGYGNELLLRAAEERDVPLFVLAAHRESQDADRASAARWKTPARVGKC
jgi:hypothetical protein